MRVRTHMALVALVLAAVASETGAATKPSRPHGATRKQVAQVRARGEEVPARARRLYEPRIAAISAEVDLEAMHDERAVAARLGAEFGVGADALLRERARLAGPWSDLMVAWTLKANARTPLTAEQIYDLHREGMAWTQVAYGLELRLLQVVSAVQAESRVAVGDVPPDGRVHPIASGLASGAPVSGAIPPAPRANVMTVRVGRY